MPSAAASIAVWNEDQVLLVKRKRAPFHGCWTLPGGRVDFGETTAQCAVRELHEETGLSVESAVLVRHFGTQLTRSEWVLAVFTARYAGGTAVAATDAEEVGWYRLGELEPLETTPGLKDILAVTKAAIAKA